MKYGLILFLVIFLVSCDEVVREQEIQGSRKTITTVDSCYKFGYCYTCEMGKCKYRVSNLCDGERQVEKEVWQVNATRKSGKQEILDRERKIRNLTECE